MENAKTQQTYTKLLDSDVQRILNRENADKFGKRSQSPGLIRAALAVYVFLAQRRCHRITDKWYNCCRVSIQETVKSLQIQKKLTVTAFEYLNFLNIIQGDYRPGSHNAASYKFLSDFGERGNLEKYNSEYFKAINQRNLNFISAVDDARRKDAANNSAQPKFESYDKMTTNLKNHLKNNSLNIDLTIKEIVNNHIILHTTEDVSLCSNELYELVQQWSMIFFSRRKRKLIPIIQHCSGVLTRYGFSITEDQAAAL